MMYLVHKHTKAHRRYADAIVWRDSDCRFFQADPDGWIEWHGGECPLQEHAETEIRFRDHRTQTRRAGSVSECWSHEDIGPNDIIAYRPVLGADTKPKPCRFHEDDTEACETYSGQVPCEPEPPAWGGESWPPVGVEVEAHYMHGATTRWLRAEILKHGVRECAVFVPEINALGWCNTFRPIRSVEEREIDRIKDIIADEFDADRRDCYLAARALYSAGYRKQEAS